MTMREILFRGKEIGADRWVHGSLDIHKSGVVVIMSDEIVASIYARVDPDTVGQFTGLTDKNGKKIFEGDICRNTRTGEIVSVKWHGTMAGFVWSKKKDNSHLFDFGALFRAFDKYEVIGNIHDNPELMEGE